MNPLFPRGVPRGIRLDRAQAGLIIYLETALAERNAEHEHERLTTGQAERIFFDALAMRREQRERIIAELRAELEATPPRPRGPRATHRQEQLDLEGAA